MKYSAVILAAGYGSRIQNLTKDHKSLLKINGKTLIEWHIEHLDKLGINKIIIVVGYQDEKIINQVGLAKYNTTIEFVRNNDYKNKGNGYSMYMGLEMTNQNDNILVIDADLVYKHEVILNFIKDPFSDSLLIGDGHLDDIECAKTLIDHNGYIRKTIDKRFINDEELDKYIFVGEAIGMIKFSKINRTNIINTCKDFFENSNNLSLNWEHLMNVYFKKSSMNTFMDKSNYWIEIDTPEDFQNAINLFLKKDIIPIT